MLLNISAENGVVSSLREFCYWLVPHIKSYAVNVTNQNSKLVTTWNTYLTNNIFKSKDNKKVHIPSFEEVVYNYFNHLAVIEESSDAITITTDVNKKSDSGYTWDYFARVINYGTLDLKGYPYFEQVFEHFANTLQIYYDTWQNGG